MRLFNFIICLGLLFGISCKQPENKKKEDLNSKVPNQHAHESDTLGIELNNGEKWKVDSHMLIHIRKMEKEVDAFGKAGQKDYVALSSELQIQIDSLTSNCTMTGQAHDELHKWLLPYIDMVDELAESQRNTDAEKRVHDINQSFVIFNKYFQ